MLIVYDPNELAKMPRRHVQLPADREGELTARVFEMLDEGRSVRQIVIHTRETQPKIEGLREQWMDSGGADLVINKHAKEELEKYLGPFETVGDLVEHVICALGMPITGTPIAEVISRGQREEVVNIEANLATGASDAKIERGINHALDAAGAP